MRTKQKIIILISVLFVALLSVSSGLVYVLETRVAPVQIPLGVVPTESVSTTTPIAKKINTGTTTASRVVDISSIDYSTLEKNRLYTKEEGKYKNLNKIGKNLLRAVLTLPKCVKDPTLSHCSGSEQQIKRSSIVALKDGVLLANTPSAKIGSYYGIYDLKQNKNISNSILHLGINSNKNLIIYVNDYDTSRQNLFYYRPGMRSFALVPNSKIPPIESYRYNIGMGLGLPDISFKNGFFTISIFNRNLPWKGGYQSKKLRQVIFNLNNLK